MKESAESKANDEKVSHQPARINFTLESRDFSLFEQERECGNFCRQ